ncbi:Uncharacterised protein [Mycobacteroides abscessus subsp. abscessus]|nr:Uncharacterised protein [Mycobacteroides abscessus subsp. abscessus]
MVWNVVGMPACASPSAMQSGRYISSSWPTTTVLVDDSSSGSSVATASSTALVNPVVSECRKPWRPPSGTSAGHGSATVVTSPRTPIGLSCVEGDSHTASVSPSGRLMLPCASDTYSIRTPLLDAKSAVAERCSGDRRSTSEATT